MFEKQNLDNEMKPENVIECHQVMKEFSEGGNSVKVLNGINFNLRRGETAAIMGRSGSGKTTLLHMLAGLDKPSSGEVSFCGHEFSKLSAKSRGLVRNRHLGFVYQFHHLLPEFTAIENVMMPLLIAKENSSVARRKAQTLLNRVGLADRLSHSPAKLSGGERQRVAIARALVNSPDCVLADEPTGNLDSHSSEMIHELMKDLNKSEDISFLLVTHDDALAHQFEKIYFMEDGELSLLAK